MKPRLFSSKEKAETELLRGLKKYMYEQINATDDDPKFNTPERWHQVDDQWELLPEHANSLQDVEEEISPFIEGEYICVRLSWDISEVHIDA